MSQAGHAGLQALGGLRVKLEAAKAYSMRDDKEPDTEAIVCDMRDKELKKAVATLPLRVCCDSLALRSQIETVLGTSMDMVAFIDAQGFVAQLRKENLLGSVAPSLRRSVAPCAWLPPVPHLLSLEMRPRQTHCRKR